MGCSNYDCDCCEFNFGIFSSLSFLMCINGIWLWEYIFVPILMLQSTYWLETMRYTWGLYTNCNLKSEEQYGFSRGCRIKDGIFLVVTIVVYLCTKIIVSSYGICIHLLDCIHMVMYMLFDEMGLMIHFFQGSNNLIASLPEDLANCSKLSKLDIEVVTSSKI